MTVSGEIGSFVANLYLSMKTEYIAWQKAHQDQLIELKEERALAEQQLKHKMEELEVRFNGRKKRIQLDEEDKTEEFRDFLDSIKETRQKILEYYPKMPKPTALNIHHHAAELLRDAWNSPNIQVALKKQLKFMELMEKVGEDFEELAEGSTKKLRPERTIKYIKNTSM
jgi:type I site-specific restriction endonuclease